MNINDEAVAGRRPQEASLRNLFLAYVRSGVGEDVLAASLREEPASDWMTLALIEHAVTEKKPAKPWLDVLTESPALLAPDTAAPVAQRLLKLLRTCEEAGAAASLLAVVRKAALSCRGGGPLCLLMAELLDAADDSSPALRGLFEAEAALIAGTIFRVPASELSAAAEELHAKKTDPRLAAVALMVADRLDPSLRSAFHAGIALFEVGEFRRACSYYREALARCPKPAAEAPVRNNLGDAYFAMGSLRSAELEFRRALQLDGAHARARYNLGVALAAQQDYHGAVDAFTAYLALVPPREGADAHRARGLAFKALEQPDKAHDDLLRAAALGSREAKKELDEARAPHRKGSDEGNEALDPESLFAEPGNVTLADFVGDRVSAFARDQLMAPLRHRRLASRFRLGGGGGAMVLAYGAPGVGKTHFSRCCAGELDDALFGRVSAADILSRWVGATERSLRALFSDYLCSVRRTHVLLLDEADSLGVERGSADLQGWERKLVSQLLTELDDLRDSGAPVIVIATSNRPGILDRALVRAGRIDHHIWFPPPDGSERERLFRLFLNGRPVSRDVDPAVLARQRYTGAEIRAVVEAASHAAFLESVEEGALVSISQRHLQAAVAEHPAKDYPAFVDQDWRSIERFQGRSVQRRVGFEPERG